MYEKELLENMEKDTNWMDSYLFDDKLDKNRKKKSENKNIITTMIFVKKDFLAPMRLKNGMLRLLKIKRGVLYRYKIKKGKMIIIAKDLIDGDKLKNTIAMNEEDFEKYFYEAFTARDAYEFQMRCLNEI